MNWKMFWSGLRALYLLRVPLATLTLLLALGPIARFSGARSLLGNLLDLSASRWDIFQVSLGAFLLAYAAVATLNLTLHYGNQRFADSGEFSIWQQRPLVTFLAGTGSAALFMVFVIVRTEYSTLIDALVTLCGFAVALGLVFVSKLLQLALTDPVITPHPPPFLVFPAYLIPALEEFFDNRYCWTGRRTQSFKKRFNQVSQWPLEILRHVGQGYLVDTQASKGSLKLQSGHVFALSLSVIAFLIYLVCGWGKRNITADVATVPALAYILLFLNVACWGLGALTFFFDRFRFPLLFVLAGLVSVTGSAPESDHFFRVETGVTRGRFLSPAEYLKIRLAPDSGTPANVVLVATPGGGIQAGAWTAQVLSGLETELGDSFRKSVTAISSVSGGSLGSLLYAATFDKLVKKEDLAEQARRSAIDEVAWGLTQPDFWRTVMPWLGRRWVDRGWALEEKWTAINHLGPKRLSALERVTGWFTSSKPEDGYPERDILLSSWKAGAGMPALLFNSMLVERGQHVVFSNTDYPRADPAESIVNFYDLYPEYHDSFDVRAVTAARLSASFPYVAPAARPDLDGAYEAGFHFVDGGYYDNYGIDALIGWIRDALQSPDPPNVKDILVLQIRHFNPAAIPGGTKPGWSFQTYAPLSGLLSMWSSAPVNRDRNELDLLRESYTASDHRKIWFATIAYDTSDENCSQAPLSWKLSPREQACIVNVWNETKAGYNQPALRCIKDYLARTTDGVGSPDCEKAQ